MRVHYILRDQVYKEIIICTKVKKEVATLSLEILLIVGEMIIKAKMIVQSNKQIAIVIVIIVLICQLEK